MHTAHTHRDSVECTKVRVYVVKEEADTNERAAPETAHRTSHVR